VLRTERRVGGAGGSSSPTAGWTCVASTSSDGAGRSTAGSTVVPWSSAGITPVSPVGADIAGTGAAGVGGAGV
jgi:hypothetical protein